MVFSNITKLSSIFLQVLIFSAVCLSSFEIIEDTKEIIRSCPEEVLINQELHRTVRSNLDHDSPDQIMPKIAVIEHFKPSVVFLNVDDEELEVSDMPSGENPLEQSPLKSMILLKKRGNTDTTNVSSDITVSMILIEWTNPEPVTCKKMEVYTSHSSDACIAKRIKKKCTKKGDESEKCKENARKTPDNPKGKKCKVKQTTAYDPMEALKLKYDSYREKKLKTKRRKQNDEINKVVVVVATSNNAIWREYDLVEQLPCGEDFFNHVLKNYDESLRRPDQSLKVAAMKALHITSILQKFESENSLSHKMEKLWILKSNSAFSRDSHGKVLRLNGFQGLKNIDRGIKLKINIMGCEKWSDRSKDGKSREFRKAEKFMKKIGLTKPDRKSGEGGNLQFIEFVDLIWPDTKMRHRQLVE